MTLYRDAAAAVAGYATGPSVRDLSIEDQRAAARAQAARVDREEVAEVRDVDADGVPCRLYLPVGDAPGLVVHLHGGGFVFHDIDVHDAPCRAFANRSGLAVLSVDYRRPPEHRFPAAVEDVDTVIGWLARQERDPAQRTYVHGDSAGGNLALGAALRHPGTFDAAALIYPFLDPTQGFDSYDTAAEGFDRAEAAWYWEQYAASPDDLHHPDLAPLRSSDERLAALPPTLIVTAEHDPLRDEGEHLAARLDALGVDVSAGRVLGQVHGFWRDVELSAADRLMRQVGGFFASTRRN
jgi:acetyl esterase